MPLKVQSFMYVLDTIGIITFNKALLMIFTFFCAWNIRIGSILRLSILLIAEHQRFLSSFR